MESTDYKAAYERQKLARQRAEELLESRSSELYESNQALQKSYEKLKNQKAQLLHQEKLASIGQLSAGIAHEINNPAGFVKSNLSSLQNYMTDMLNLITCYQSLSTTLMASSPSESVADSLKKAHDIEEEVDIEYLIEDVPELVTESISGMQRIITIVDGLKNFSRVDSDKKELLNVNLCIENTIKLVQNEIKYKADLIQDLGELPETMGYPGSLGQVILNLLVNASQAIPNFGKIMIRSQHRGDWIIVQVKDNGSGIEEEVVNKLFDPFFTTKEVGEGTGLGLSISQGIVKKHEGRITVNSQLGKGTVFTLFLPVIPVTQ